MGWERRGNREYYYQAERVCGRVVKRYVGTGRIGELAAELDSFDRTKRDCDREQQRAEREEMDLLDASLNELHNLADLLAQAALIAAGFRQHHRGEWRKSRGGTDQAK